MWLEIYIHINIHVYLSTSYRCMDIKVPLAIVTLKFKKYFICKRAINKTAFLIYLLVIFKLSTFCFKNSHDFVYIFIFTIGIIHFFGGFQCFLNCCLIYSSFLIFKNEYLFTQSIWFMLDIAYKI